MANPTKNKITAMTRPPTTYCEVCADTEEMREKISIKISADRIVLLNFAWKLFESIILYTSLVIKPCPGVTLADAMKVESLRASGLVSLEVRLAVVDGDPPCAAGVVVCESRDVCVSLYGCVEIMMLSFESIYV